MTHKLILLFKTPANPTHFQERWSTDFVPLAERLPGLRRITVSWVTGGPVGPVDIHLIHELHFDSLEALTTAMMSPAGVAAGQGLVRLAGQQVTLLFAEHSEDAHQHV